MGRRPELFGHIFYDFETSLLDIMVEDWKPTFDPTENHTLPNFTDPVNPPIPIEPDLLQQHKPNKNNSTNTTHPSNTTNSTNSTIPSNNTESNSTTNITISSALKTYIK